MTRSLRVSMTLAFAMTVGAGVAHADGDAAKGEKVFAKCKACHGRGQ